MLDRKYCHWCGDELLGVISEFTHCVRCNEKRVSGGTTNTFDPCHVCMTLKSRRINK